MSGHHSKPRGGDSVEQDFQFRAAQWCTVFLLLASPALPTNKLQGELDSSFALDERQLYTEERARCMLK